MNHINLSLRLCAAAQWVPWHACLCDVGTDHAALPIWLLQQGKLSHAIATDIRPGPLARALNNVNRYSYAEQVELRLCNGLAAVTATEADTVTICGMGGNMMISILEAAPWTKNAITLILQPMKSQRELRRWLHSSGYFIEQERVLWEEGHWYTLFLVRGGNDPDPLTPGRETAGIPTRWWHEESRLAYLEDLQRRIEKQKNGLQRASCPPDRVRIDYLSSVLSELTAWQNSLQKGVWPI